MGRTKSQKCTQVTGRARLCKGEQFSEAADIIETVLEENDLIDAYITLCVHAGQNAQPTASWKWHDKQFECFTYGKRAGTINHLYQPVPVLAAPGNPCETRYRSNNPCIIRRFTPRCA